MRRRDFIALAGGVAVWPLPSHAQQAPLPVIGFLSVESPALDEPRLTSFRQGLKEHGYVEGHNITIEYRGAENKLERLPALAADLLDHKVSVIACVGPAATLAAKARTSTIPIAFAIASDPVRLGLVESFNRPGGNVTGVTSLASLVIAKQFEALREMVPEVVLFAFLVDSTIPHAEQEIASMQAAAAAIGRKILVLKARTEKDIEAAFTDIVQQRAGALAVGNSALFNSRRDQLATLAARHALPTITPTREFVTAGGLMSYGSSLADTYRLTGVHVARILKGEKAAMLPVIQATRVELVINLKTAKALGITVPSGLLARADEVIE